MRYVFILMVILCTSCGTALPTIKPYKLDVQQGNVVTSKMLLQLRPGMTKSQVRFIMGTPLIQDSFHGNRWDYAYQLRENGKVTEQRRVILDFEKDLLKAVRGDVVPSGSDGTKLDEDPVNIGTRIIKPKAKPEEKGLLSKLKFWGDDEVKAPKAAAPVSAPVVDVKPVEVQSNLTPKPLAVEVAQKNTDMVKDDAVSATENENVKSVLVVPVEAVLASESVVTAPSVNEQKAVVEHKLEAKPELEQATPSLPDNISFYQSVSGMVFERTLRFVAEVIEPQSKPQPAAPRAGNKEVPKPKELPAEGEPGFFDRMLEKIGF